MTRDATLDVLRAIAEALTDGDRKSPDIAIRNFAIGAISAAGREIDSEEANLLPYSQSSAGCILAVRQRINAQSERVARVHKT